MRDWFQEPEIRFLKLMSLVAVVAVLGAVAWVIIQALTLTSAVVLGIVVVAAATVWAILALCLETVHKGYAMIVERWGKHKATRKEGTYFLWPLIDRPKKIVWWYDAQGIDGTRRVLGTTARIDMREDMLDIPPAKVITKDKALVEIDVAAYIRIIDAEKVAYEVTEPLREIEVLVQTTLRNLIAAETLDHALRARDRINQELQRVLTSIATQWGIEVKRVEVQRIVPTPDVASALEQQLSAEMRRVATITTAHANREADKITAEGYRETRHLMAEADAESRKTLAQGEGIAIRTIAQALPAEGENEKAKHVVAMRYFETWKELVSGPSTKVVYMPYETSSILGLVGGIKEDDAGTRGRKHGQDLVAAERVLQQSGAR